MMKKESVTIPRDLFERLVAYTEILQGKPVGDCGGQWFARPYKMIDRAVKIRDRKPKRKIIAWPLSMSLRHFKNEKPLEGQNICFVCPIERDRWEIGWSDVSHYRVEGGESYAHDDARLTFWFPLPKIET
jgi:hypothetical protein